MQYPLISEYVRAMQDPAGNLDQLAHLVPVLDDHGEPMRSSGAFAVVFKMKDESTGKEYALKCFTEEQEGRAEAYRQIADELESVDSTYFTSVKYLEKELFVDCDGDDHEFPVLLMDWIDGETMDRYIAENLYDNYTMSMLCYRFCKMAAWLRSQPFAHGDIKPDNIMVRPDGTLTLIDYDGMFVPSMKGQTSPTIGTKDFSHPLRTKEDFDETIDDFALASIALSLKAIALSPSLFDEYGSSDRLLFSVDDYRDLSQSKLLTALKPLMTDSELNTLLSLFLLAHATKTLSMASFRLFSVSKPEYIPVILSTKVTNDDLAEAIEDEFGVKYSKDRKRLLRVPEDIKGEYHIRKGTICICDSAFRGCEKLINVEIPDRVTVIGEAAFQRCSDFRCINIPKSVMRIGKKAFGDCQGLKSISIASDNMFFTSINNCCLSKDAKTLYFGCMTSVIPDGVTTIGDYAFDLCDGLINIVIPNSVIEIGAYAFSECNDLTNIVIPNSVTKIGEWAFSGCNGLTSIVIPNSVTKIGEGAFYECHKPIKLEGPNSVAEIGSFAFFECDGLTDVYISNRVTEIKDNVFCGCSGLTSIVIPNSVTKIGKSAFSFCSGLTKLDIPNNVTEISDWCFSGCRGLTNIVIPNRVTKIGEHAFDYCSCLSNINLPRSVTEIGEYAFCECSFLIDIVIPDSIIKIGRGAFWGCRFPENLKSSIISMFGEEVFSPYDLLASLKEEERKMKGKTTAE